MKRHKDRAKILAGGQSLIPIMKLRLANPEILIDIGRIPGLDSIREQGNLLRIGAMARHRDLETSRITRANRYAVLSDAARVIGDPEVRNMGTVGGSLAHADPAGDWGAALLALDAKLITKGPKGTRTIPIDDFFLDMFTSSLKPGEILTEIRIPKPGARSGGAYKKLKRKTGDFATVAAAAQVELDGKGAVAKIGIGLAAVAPTPLRARSAEDALRGKAPTQSLVAQAARAAAADCHPTGDLRGSEDFKRAMVEVFTRRALEAALERAGR